MPPRPGSALTVGAADRHGTVCDKLDAPGGVERRKEFLTDDIGCRGIELKDRGGCDRAKRTMERHWQVSRVGEHRDFLGFEQAPDLDGIRLDDVRTALREELWNLVA